MRYSAASWLLPAPISRAIFVVFDRLVCHLGYLHLSPDCGYGCDCGSGFDCDLETGFGCDGDGGVFGDVNGLHCDLNDARHDCYVP